MPQRHMAWLGVTALAVVALLESAILGATTAMAEPPTRMAKGARQEIAVTTGDVAG